VLWPARKEKSDSSAEKARTVEVMEGS